MSAATQATTTQMDFHDLRGHTTRTERIRDYRRIEVGRMLLARVPIRVMAQRLNVSTATVQKDIKTIERHWAETRMTDRAKLIEREQRVLDTLEAAWLERAHWDDAAVDVLLRIQARRTKLLGLDTPVRSEVEVKGDTDGLRSRALELATQELQRRRELDARAAISSGEVIDV